MTLVRVLERQYDADGRPKIGEKMNPSGQIIKYTKSKTYYMDLSQEDEKQLRDTGRFGFETVLPADKEKITPAQKQEGSKRKKIVLQKVD